MKIDQDFDGELYELDVRIDENENLTHTAHYPIKSGPKTHKSINIFDINASESGKKIVSFWKSRPDSSDILVADDSTKFECKPDEIERLIALLDNLEEVAELDRGEYVFLRKDSPPTQAAIAAIDSIETVASDQVEQLAVKLIESVKEVESEIADFDTFSESLSKEVFSVENLIGCARTQQAVSQFEELIQDEKNEREYQNFLEEHPWLFGNRYIRKSDTRKFTRNEEVDFCLETVDGYYDIFEIKLPEHDVLHYDNSHDCHYASSRLSKSISQTENYIKEIEANQSDILRRDDMNILKPRGTIVIGADLTLDEQEGLRIFNSYLNQIRVITYTEIVSMGKRLIEMYNADSPVSI